MLLEVLLEGSERLKTRLQYYETSCYIYPSGDRTNISEHKEELEETVWGARSVPQATEPISIPVIRMSCYRETGVRMQ